MCSASMTDDWFECFGEALFRVSDLPFCFAASAFFRLWEWWYVFPTVRYKFVDCEGSCPMFANDGIEQRRRSEEADFTSNYSN